MLVVFRNLYPHFSGPCLIPTFELRRTGAPLFNEILTAFVISILTEGFLTLYTVIYKSWVCGDIVIESGDIVILEERRVHV